MSEDDVRAYLTAIAARPDTARAGLLEPATIMPMAAVSRALLALLLGRREEAAGHYEALRRRLAEPGMDSLPPFVINMVPLVEEFGDTATAEVLRAVLERLPLTQGGAGTYCSGSMSRPLARLEVVPGLLDEATGHFEQALALDECCGARPLVVRDRLGLASVLLERVGRPTSPAPPDWRARRSPRPGGSAYPGRNARRPPWSSGRAGRRAADPLTEREREIAALVAEALTNRQIADRLALSERRMESHVRNILAKLGLANRTEIATTRGARPRSRVSAAERSASAP